MGWRVIDMRVDAETGTEDRDESSRTRLELNWRPRAPLIGARRAAVWVGGGGGPKRRASARGSRVEWGQRADRLEGAAEDAGESEALSRPASSASTWIYAYIQHKSINILYCSLIYIPKKTRIRTQFSYQGENASISKFYEWDHLISLKHTLFDTT